MCMFSRYLPEQQATPVIALHGIWRRETHEKVPVRCGDDRRNRYAGFR
jgi:hypothetical protein